MEALEAEERHKGPHHEGEAMSEDDEEEGAWPDWGGGGGGWGWVGERASHALQHIAHMRVRLLRKRPAAAARGRLCLRRLPRLRLPVGGEAVGAGCHRCPAPCPGCMLAHLPAATCPPCRWLPV